MEQVRRAIALGFFDGVHIGHAALLNCVKERAAELDAIPSVLSFDVHPDTLVHGKEIPLINSLQGREDLIQRLFGIENVVFLHFNKLLMRMSWDEFIADLVKELNICSVVVGHDFTFGYKGQGNPDLLKAWCEERNICCDVIPPVMLDDIVVSSTYIRNLVEAGCMEEARRFLGHPHVLTDTVHSGYHLGRKLGTPTINMFFPEGVIVPRHGVYATKVYLSDGTEHTAVTNIGVRPTVSEGNRVSVESHLLDFSGNLYGRQARVEFYHFLRSEKKFSGYQELSDQIHRDSASARYYFMEQPEN